LKFDFYLNRKIQKYKKKLPSMASFSNNFRGRESDDDNLDDSDNEEKQEKQSDLKKICKLIFLFI
jgi:hypothetical protein